jgi:hypothetical protein
MYSTSDNKLITFVKKFNNSFRKVFHILRIGRGYPEDDLVRYIEIGRELI